MPDRLRPFRTTAFRLSAIFLGVFTVFAAFLIGYIARNTTRILQAEMGKAIEAEPSVMSDQYRRGGIEGLGRFIEVRSFRPGASLYLLTDPRGVKLAGNVESVPSGLLDPAGPGPEMVPYVRINEDDTESEHSALVSVVELPDSYRVLVGRDVSETEELVALVRRAMIYTVALMVVLGLVSWIFVQRTVLKRIESIAGTSRQIMAGDLSGRLEVTGTDDEFDRLAESLNRMLERIERLMVGLKQMSDNIAHDLKTPLNRMRNRVEAALTAEPATPNREVLQATIDDADQLIRTFNALLTIARVEAGSSDAEFVSFDASQVARDVFELYEPLAEEAGVALKLEATAPIMMRANRELISQALANLVDNAVKYAEEGAAKPAVVMSVGEEGGAVNLSVVDNGAGIAESDRGRVTERFVRLEESRSKPGAGLGLSLVSAIAQLHGGRLVLSDNRPGLAAILQMPGTPVGRAA